ncbi:MAG: Glu/Leu/Phe/Val dehydrogenase [Chloroflexi bacterium]|nr:Glu/Leu/Phe/Val dehydrogenase [Chloroflexota bacterium]
MGAEEEIFGYADELGPEKVLHFYDRKLNLRGILVVDNTALGPGFGGIRMAPDVTTKEVFRLARAMTFKNSAAGIPYGGAKGAILGDPAAENKDQIIRAYAGFLRPHTDYMPGPDMGTNEQCMGIIFNEIGRAVGLPRELGGLDLDEVGATGYGVAEVAEVAAGYIGLDLKGATAVIEGFGAVGQAAFRCLAGKGVKIVALSDVNGGICDPDGLDYDALLTVEPKTCRVTKLWNREYKGGQRFDGAGLFQMEADILIPGARPDVVTMNNVGDVKARMVVEAANIPVTREAEEYLAEKGVLVVPDFIANAGGVIAGAVEVQRGTEEEAFHAIKAKIGENVRAVLDMAHRDKLYPRVAAERLARERVVTAMRGGGE